MHNHVPHILSNARGKITRMRTNSHRQIQKTNKKTLKEHLLETPYYRLTKTLDKPHWGKSLNQFVYVLPVLLINILTLLLKSFAMKCWKNNKNKPKCLTCLC